MKNRKTAWAYLGAGTALALSGTYLWVALRKPPTLPESSRELTKAYFALDTSTIENHLFESEIKRYPWDQQKASAVREILKRCLSKISILKVDGDTTQKEMGQGWVDVVYATPKSQKAFKSSVPSYLTPDGTHTGLMDTLIFAWIAEYRSEFGDAPEGSSLLVEASLRGIKNDRPILEKAGFKELSQNGLTFASIDAIEKNIVKLASQSH